MSDPFNGQPFPRGALWAGAILIGLTMGLTLLARLSPESTVSSLPADEVHAREMVFEDRADHGIRVLNVSGDVIAEIEPGTQGFLRATLRNLSQDRADGNEHVPFRIARHADGRVSVSDPLSGRFVVLDAFGADNAALFGDLLDAANKLAPQTNLAFSENSS